jgi:hypothetical protein
MKESEIRRHLAEVQKQLDEERAKNERAQQTIADLAKAAAAGALPLGQPCPCVPPAPMPTPNPAHFPPYIPYAYATPFGDGLPIVTLYACQTFDQPPPTSTTWIQVSSTPPKASK